MANDIDFAKLIGPVARKLWGPENTGLSNGKELRWGNRGSKCVDLEKGVWCDHETGESGGTLDLIKLVKGFKTNKDAIKWLADEGLIPKLSEPKRRPKIVATYDYRDEFGSFCFKCAGTSLKTSASDGRTETAIGFTKLRACGASFITCSD
jgi:putative DNA primase/helicase